MTPKEIEIFLEEIPQDLFKKYEEAFEFRNHEEKIKHIQENIPEDVYLVFTKEWDNFIYSCSENASEFIDDETVDGEDFEKYFEIFMTYPH